MDGARMRKRLVPLSLLIAIGLVGLHLHRFHHVRNRIQHVLNQPTDVHVHVEARPVTPWQRILKHQEELDEGKRGGTAPEKCSHLYGIDHVLDYRNPTTLCQGQEEEGGSLVRCANFSSTHPSAERDRHKEAICEASNLMLHGKTLQQWNDLLEQTHNSKGKEEGQPIPPKGLLSGRCKSIGAGVNHGTTGYGGQRFLRMSFQASNISALEQEEDMFHPDPPRVHRKIGSKGRSTEQITRLSCEAVVEHTVYLVADPWGYKNLWHGLEEITSMFVAYAVHDLDPAHTQVLVAEGRTGSTMEDTFGVHGPLVYSFSKVAPPMSLVDAMKQLAPQGGNVCLKRVVFSTWGQPSMQAAGSYWDMVRLRISIPYACGPSSIFLGLRDHILEHLGRPDLQVDPYNKRILWLERSTRLTGHEAEMLQVVEQAASQYHASVIRQDLSLLEYTEQVRFVQTASMLVGLHGAALTWGFLLPQGGSIIEISKESLGARCYCYVTAAKSVGATHYSVVYQRNSAAERDSLRKAVSSALANLHKSRLNGGSE